MAADPFVNRSIDHFKIQRLLGKGGMGSVYLAHDSKLGRDVALKVMHPRFAKESSFRKRFLDEARATAKLNHPGIVQVYEFKSSPQLYIVMEFIQGGNLQEMLDDLRAQNRWLPLEEAIELIQQVGFALDYAHKQGILHRDIKPDNIMLKRDSGVIQPVITDLGLAQMAGAKGEASGTPAYMSPEQAMGKDLDRRSDAYSLGVLLYELCVGRLPFPARTLAEAREYHGRKRVPAPKSIHAELPTALEEIIQKALKKNPRDRFNSTKDLAAALGTINLGRRRASVPPRASGGVGSLMTQLQEQKFSVRGVSVLDEFEDFRPQGPGQDYIQVLRPDGTNDAVAIEGRIFTIGRGSENNLKIEDARASRNHVRIEYNGGKYEVTDQKSQNGTFIDGVALLSGSPDTWRPGQHLQIGKHNFRLISADSASSIQQANSAASRAGVGGQVGARSQDAMRQSSMEARQQQLGNIRIRVEPAELSVAPGSVENMQATISNFSDEVVHYRTEVAGVPDEWVTLTPSDNLELMPGDEKNVHIQLQPPSSVKTRAGRWRVEVRGISGEADQPLLTAKATLSIAAVHRFESELRHNQVKTGEKLSIRVKNLSNKEQTFTLSAWDGPKELRFRIPQKQIRIAAGHSGSFDFSAVPRRRRWIGGLENHQFNAKVSLASSNPDTAQSSDHSGTVESKGLIPKWVPPALVAILLAAAAAGFGYYNRVETQKAEAIAAAETATASAVAALTATATALIADPDQDGLTTEREIALNTSPNDPDSDDDGLTDGLEVNEWQTDPLVVDTDGDRVPDGREVDTLIDPLNPDTDGDGIGDHDDQHPKETSTPIPDHAATAEVEANQTAVSKQETAQAAQVTAIAEQTKIALTAAAEFRSTTTAEARLTEIASGTKTAGIAATNAAATAKAQSTADQALILTQQAEKADALATQQAAEQQAREAAAKQEQDSIRATQAAQSAAQAAAQATQAAQNAEIKKTQEALEAQLKTRNAPTPTRRPTPTPRTTGMNLDAYCTAKGLDGTDRVNGTVFGWRCRDGRTLIEIDFDEVCAMQEGRASVASYTNRNNFKSWTCTIP